MNAESSWTNYWTEKGNEVGIQTEKAHRPKHRTVPLATRSLLEAWEERILVFLDQFPVTFAKTKKATDEMCLLVRPEACLLIVRRPLRLPASPCDSLVEG